jgi:hypothetical protein
LGLPVFFFLGGILTMTMTTITVMPVTSMVETKPDLHVTTTPAIAA